MRADRVVEWKLTDAGWRPVNPADEIAALVERVRAVTEANRALISRSRHLIETTRRNREMRHAWARPVDSLLLQ